MNFIYVTIHMRFDKVLRSTKLHSKGFDFSWTIILCWVGVYFWWNDLSQSHWSQKWLFSSLAWNPCLCNLREYLRENDFWHRSHWAFFTLEWTSSMWFLACFSLTSLLQSLQCHTFFFSCILKYDFTWLDTYHIENLLYHGFVLYDPLTFVWHIGNS